jgi:hypothetical protein
MIKYCWIISKEMLKDLEGYGHSLICGTNDNTA